MMAAEGQELSGVFGRNKGKRRFCPWPQKVVEDTHPTESLAMTDQGAE